ncbi:MAG: TIM barrel protein [Oscillospiraceae bacterium]|nr:TIM barrel protein [Oscillospiraceae bacterium]
MKHILNVVSENTWLEPYKDKAGMNKFIADCLCDGCEVIRGGEDTTGIYGKDNVIGVHLFFYPAWLDFWNNDIPNLEKHFGKREIWESYYNAKNREEFLLPYRADMEYAEEIGAEYVVFHVNDVSNEEVISYKWEHTDEEVIRAVAEIVNELTRGKNYHFKLLFENLFTPGMMLLKPAETALMLELTDYSNKGILMDTGHLMCAPQNIYTEEQGIQFVLDTVKKHGELAKEFKALHLHKSVTGEYIQKHKSLEIVPKEEFYDRWAQGYEIILNIDMHQPFENPRVQEILELVEPEYVTHEISAKTREEKIEKVLRQMKALGRI